MEGSLVAYKVFTNGSVLNASEINENLMQQSTAVFSNAAARTAAITSPVEGQMSYLEDVDRLQIWSGSAWVSPFGLTLLSSTAFSAATTVTANNFFTSEFSNYKAILEMTSASAGGTITLQYSNNTTPITAASYNMVRTSGTFSGTNEVSAVSSSTSHALGIVSTTANTFDLDISNVSSTGATKLPVILFRKFGPGGTGGFTAVTGGGRYETAAQVTGFGLTISSGNMTGSLKVYGVRG
jgi:hypothetical protein